MCVNVNSKDFKSGFDRVGIGIHNSSKVGEIAFDFVESVGDQSCLVIELLHGDWFVHGAKCYTSRALGVKYSQTDVVKAEKLDLAGVEALQD